MSKFTSRIAWPLLGLWMFGFAVDYCSVKLQGEPVFCSVQEEETYVCSGYSYRVYKHPVTGRNEYTLELFGEEVVCTITN